MIAEQLDSTLFIIHLIYDIGLPRAPKDQHKRLKYLVSPFIFLKSSIIIVHNIMAIAIAS